MAKEKNLSISADVLPQFLRCLIFMITLGVVVFILPVDRPEWCCSILKQMASNMKYLFDAFLSTGIHIFVLNWLQDLYPGSFSGFIFTAGKAYAAFAIAAWAKKIINSQGVLEAFHEKQLDEKPIKEKSRKSKTKLIYNNNFE
ncbi:Oidioi.mRNA.OKI2018_I69.PAR.g8975.t1.cds [Oikopleura dioica]|uniref:Oidioi.mRNA.OKI2018_I69.PAR.g8975.t1.cds n=1 Tax=Oikopleura dioica TaxID=34765 RepID=A0ABN7RL44_OIKDI|nr:Oidioi.mRNA.OKI2018_I69.PAR.g8975.t1.cds [Oikopleura dioica]